MPAELASGIPRVLPSAPSELAFALFALTCNHQKNSRVREVIPAELRYRVSEFWRGPDKHWTQEDSDWSEVLLAAQRTGTLFDPDLDGFFQSLESELEAGIPVPAMRTEYDEDREANVGRLKALARSLERRRGYVTILRDVWEILRPEWAQQGRETAERWARSMRDDLARSNDLRAVVPRNSLARRDRFASVLDANQRSGGVVIVPLYFAGEGQFMTELDGVLLVAFGQESDSGIERKRKQAEVAAARFKLLSDPTRAAILATLTHSPNSITDLADRFGLAQPTVSVHIKALREGGFLESDKQGAHTLYRAKENHIRRSVEEALDELFRK